MPGNRIGGLKAREKNLENDPDFYKKIGKIGGQRGHTGGFYANRALARSAGRKGGLVSRRKRLEEDVKEQEALEQAVIEA